MPKVVPECESIDRICEHVADDKNPREAAGETLCIDLAEKSERSAPFAVIGGQLHVAISCSQGDETRGCKAEPCPCAGDPDDHTECREDTTVSTIRTSNIQGGVSTIRTSNIQSTIRTSK
jgi:hypothetical protein